MTGSDFDFLETLTKAIIDSSRIHPGQSVINNFGPNNTGGVLIKPGGGGSYPSFWIRDYAMSLETGFITEEEQKHMLLLTASTQADQTWITKNGSMVPFGEIADHIRIDDSLPIYFPGTYSYEDQGTSDWGKTLPHSDQFYFIHMANYYVKTIADPSIVMDEIKGLRLIDRLEIAFNVPPSRLDNHIVFTTEDFRGIDFGFRDVITITGKSNQADVWATSLAIYLDILDDTTSKRASQYLSDSYKNGTLAYNGNIRHIVTSDDFSDSTAWEISMAKKDTYQNGAYWGTPTGWVCYAIAKTDFKLAQKLAGEFIDDLRKNDFGKGTGFGAPYECFHPSGYKQNPLYMTTVSCPLVAFKSISQTINQKR